VQLEGGGTLADPLGEDQLWDAPRFGQMMVEARRGHRKAQLELGIKLLEPGRFQNFRQARVWFERASVGATRDQRDIELRDRALYYKAQCLLEGLGGETDITQAHLILEQLFETTRAKYAYTTLGLHLYRSEETREEGLRYLRNGARLGSSFAILLVGLISHRNGDYDQARSFFEQSHRANFPLGTYYYGKYLHGGLGGETLPDTARAMWRSVSRVQKERSRYSPFQLAVLECELEAVRVMLENGASLVDLTPDGLTVYQLAIKTQNRDLVSLIEPRERESRFQERLLFVEERFREMRDRVELLEEEMENERIINQEQNRLSENEPISFFYLHIQRKLTELFTGYIALDSGLVQRTTDTVDTLTGGIRLLGELVPLPGTGLVTSVIAAGIDYLHEERLRCKREAVARLIVNPLQMGREIELGARLVSNMYEPQIESLDERSAELLAECGVYHFIYYIQENDEEDVGSLSEQLVRALAHFNREPRWFITIIPREREIAIIDGTRWTDLGIFQKSGIVLEDSTYYEGDPEMARIYGYRKWTQAGAERSGFRRVPVVESTEVSPHTEQSPDAEPTGNESDIRSVTDASSGQNSEKVKEKVDLRDPSPSCVGCCSVA
jgi:TPR repeat protein